MSAEEFRASLSAKRHCWSVDFTYVCVSTFTHAYADAVHTDPVQFLNPRGRTLVVSERETELYGLRVIAPSPLYVALVSNSHQIARRSDRPR